ISSVGHLAGRKTATTFRFPNSQPGSEPVTAASGTTEQGYLNQQWRWRSSHWSQNGFCSPIATVALSAATSQLPTSFASKATPCPTIGQGVVHQSDKPLSNHRTHNKQYYKKQ